MFRPLLITAAVLALLAGCSKQEAPVANGAAPAPAPVQSTAQPAAAAPAEAAPAAVPVAAAAPRPAAAPVAGQSVDIFGGTAGSAVVPQNHNRGKVLEVLNGGGYTYAEVQMASGKKVWIAGSAIDARQGTEVEWGNYAPMRGFHSKSLGRSFEEILFVDRWNPVGKAAVAVQPHGTYPDGRPATAAAASADALAAAAAGASPAAADPSARGTVKSVVASGGYSYIEVDQGGGKTVWVAAMETPMKAGDKVQWQGGTQMSNFTARSINRTFDRIIFAQTVAVGK